MVLAKFVTQPLHLETIFRLTFYIHKLEPTRASSSSHERCPILALCSSMRIASLVPTTSLVPTCHQIWYLQIRLLLRSTSISIDRLPPFMYSQDAPQSSFPQRTSSIELPMRTSIENIFKPLGPSLVNRSTPCWLSNQAFLTNGVWFYSLTSLSTTPLVPKLRFPLTCPKCALTNYKLELITSSNKTKFIAFAPSRDGDQKRFILRCPIYYEIYQE